ncbi:hypothetical protein [Pseudomonas veronii]
MKKPKAKANLKVCTITLDAETHNQFREVANAHKFPLSRFINDCMKEYLNVSKVNGFNKDVTLNVEIRNFNVTNKEQEKHEE